VSFEVGQNEILGLLGPNGAGKTTIINMILAVLEPTSGSIFVEATDVRRKRRKAMARNLRIFGLLYAVDDPANVGVRGGAQRGARPAQFPHRVRVGLIARSSAENVS